MKYTFLLLIILGCTTPNEKKQEAKNNKTQYEELLAKNLANISEIIEGEIIGEWYDSTPYIEGKWTISKNNGKYYLMREFKDGSGDSQIIENSLPNGKGRFLYNDGRDYIIIDDNGNLAFYDTEYGYINTAKKLN